MGLLDSGVHYNEYTMFLHEYSLRDEYGNLYVSYTVWAKTALEAKRIFGRYAYKDRSLVASRDLDGTVQRP